MDLDKQLLKVARDNDKALSKVMNLQVKKEISTEKRVPLKTDLRKKIYDKFKNKCNITGCTVKVPKPLDVHHMNMKPGDNNPNNLRLLCPTHHREEHQKKFRRRYKNQFGEVTGTKLVKKVKGKAPKIRKKKVGFLGDHWLK